MILHVKLCSVEHVLTYYSFRQAHLVFIVIPDYNYYFVIIAFIIIFIFVAEDVEYRINDKYNIVLCTKCDIDKLLTVFYYSLNSQNCYKSGYLMYKIKWYA
ncbi:hypothetical protein QTP88_020181 [Uroleucon formosanum]